MRPTINLKKWRIGQKGRPVVEVTYRIVFDGLDELEFKMGEIVGHLEAARVLFEELSGEHELTPRAVRESDLCGGADGATTLGADSGIRLHVNVHPA